MEIDTSDFEYVISKELIKQSNKIVFAVKSNKYGCCSFINVDGCIDYEDLLDVLEQLDKTFINDLKAGNIIKTEDLSIEA